MAQHDRLSALNSIFDIASNNAFEKKALEIFKFQFKENQYIVLFVIFYTNTPAISIN